jgi:hypothetical protein
MACKKTFRSPPEEIRKDMLAVPFNALAVKKDRKGNETEDNLFLNSKSRLHRLKRVYGDVSVVISKKGRRLTLAERCS